MHKLIGLRAQSQQLPVARANKKFMVVAVDYFTKWAKVEALAKIGQPEMKAFVSKSIAYRFGISQVLVTDYRTQFDGSSSASSASSLTSSNIYPFQDILR